MTKKTIKDVDYAQNILKEAFEDLKIKFNILSQKQEHLENEITEMKKNTGKRSDEQTIFICKKCGKQFENKGSLQKHIKSDHSNKEVFRCDVCENSFDVDWKLSAHKKKHEVYACTLCDKKFKYNEIQLTYVVAAHKEKKIYCHFYNNNLECQFGEEKCAFVYEESEVCRYGEECERDMCMFKHIVEVNEETSVNEDDVDNEDAIEDESEKTFSNPSQSEEYSLETFKFMVLAPCRDKHLANDQKYYWTELEKLSEISNVKKVYVHSKSGYEIGTHLDTYVEFETEFGGKFKNDQAFRQHFWAQLDMKEIKERK